MPAPVEEAGHGPETTRRSAPPAREPVEHLSGRQAAPGQRRWRITAAGLLWAGVLLVALAMRLPTLFAAFPYVNYVDEGHVLHRVVNLLRNGGWDPGWYIYPALPNYAIAGAAALYAPIYRAVHGHSLHEDLAEEPYSFYDVVDPPELLVFGRVLTLALALGSVVLTGLLARRLAGPTAGLLAAWLAALLPAMVIRGAVVNVDAWAVFFSLAALVFAERLRDSPRPAKEAALAGAMTGLAFVSKYTAVLVCLPVALAIVERAWKRWREVLRLLVLSGAAAVVTAAVSMPALVLRTGKVLEMVGYEASLYATGVIGSYWQQALLHAEWDQPLARPELGLPFLVLAAGGLVVALGDRRWARAARGWLLMGAAFAALLAPFPFRAFRNLLVFVPLAAVLVALLYARLRRAARWRRGFDVAAAALPVLLFGASLHEYVGGMVGLEDSRTQAIRWLATHCRPEDHAVFAAELAFLPTQINTLPCEARVARWPRWRRALQKDGIRYAVLGRILLDDGGAIPEPVRREIGSRYQLRAKFGFRVTPEEGGLRRDNRQTVYILERQDAPAGVFPDRTPRPP